MVPIVARSSFTFKCITQYAKLLQTLQNHSCYSTALPSWKVSFPENYTKYNEISQDYWKYVERLKPLRIIPEPPQLPCYSSGWIPPHVKSPNLPYFVGRTKNHMTPVYLRFEEVRGQRKVTIIKHIEGDIWELERLLKSYLEKEKGRTIVSQVHEVAMFIKFRGDHVLLVKDWLLKAGF